MKPFKHRPDASKNQILMPCPKHKKMPDITVCSHCLGDMGEFAAIAEQTLTKMPQVYGELFGEGMLYFESLAIIAQDPNIRCGCPNGDHDDQCPKTVARNAIAGHEDRILHRPTDGQLANLKKDAKEWIERSQRPHVEQPEPPKLVTP